MRTATEIDDPQPEDGMSTKKKEGLREDLLTQHEAAKYIGVSVSWMRGTTADRPPRIRLGRRVYYTKAMLDAYIESQTEQASDMRPPDKNGRVWGGLIPS